MSIHRRSAFLFAGIILALGCSSTSDAPSAAAGAGGTAGAPSSAGGSTNIAGGGASAAGASASGGAAAGASGGNASAGAGSHITGTSSGCGKPNADTPKDWTMHSINVTVDAAFAADYSTRTYFTRPPKNYDPNHAYPVTVWGNGCGQSAAEPTQISSGPGADGSIMVEMLANPKNHNCYSAGPDGDNASSPEVPYFDAVLAEAEAEFCIDRGKVFMGGWSSGGWFTTLLACTRSNVIKGVGWASAGLQLNHPACMGPMPAILERGVDDNGTPLAQTDAAREDLRLRNGCSTETEAWDPGETAFTTTTCVSYKGCMPGFPLVWCPIPGGHNNGGTLSSIGFWKFWTALP